MSIATFSNCCRGIVLFLVYMLWSACALIPKPDTCECSSCEQTLSKSDNSLDRIPLESIAPGSERTIYICACRPWNQSGIIVEQGQEYHFQIPKGGEIEAWTDGPADATPMMGWTGNLENTIGYLLSFLKRSPDANWYALVGAIGQCDEDTFAVSPKPVVMPQKGELYFYANDMKGRYFNNRGIIKLNVVRVR